MADDGGVWWMMAVYTRRHVVEGIVQEDFIFSLWLFWGKP
jgi:hypothetical protein